jgi:hypothetical protein
MSTNLGIWNASFLHCTDERRRRESTEPPKKIERADPLGIIGALQNLLAVPELLSEAGDHHYQIVCQSVLHRFRDSGASPFNEP